MSVAVLGLLTAGVALEFWPFPWGSYAHGFDAPLAETGGIVQALGTVALTLGLTLFALDGVRRSAMPIWIAPLLPLGAFTTFWLTPVHFVPGIVWLALGSALVSQNLARFRASLGPGSGAALV